ncbi:hypothetical protein LguiA_034585 [Lonicera macranthoides]
MSGNNLMEENLWLDKCMPIQKERREKEGQWYSCFWLQMERKKTATIKRKSNILHQIKITGTKSLVRRLLYVAHHFFDHLVRRNEHSDSFFRLFGFHVSEDIRTTICFTEDALNFNIYFLHKFFVIVN